MIAVPQRQVFFSRIKPFSDVMVVDVFNFGSFMSICATAPAVIVLSRGNVGLLWDLRWGIQSPHMWE